MFIPVDQTDTDVKRGAAIGYVYENDNTAQHTDESNKKTVNQNEKLFLPDENLKLPTDMAHVRQLICQFFLF